MSGLLVDPHLPAGQHLHVGRLRVCRIGPSLAVGHPGLTTAPHTNPPLAIVFIILVLITNATRPRPATTTLADLTPIIALPSPSLVTSHRVPIVATLLPLADPPFTIVPDLSVNSTHAVPACPTMYLAHNHLCVDTFRIYFNVESVDV